MFEKKNEVDEKIGDLGQVTVDITEQMNVDSQISLNFAKDLIPAIPGGLKVKAVLALEIDADPLSVGLHYLGQSGNPAVKWIADELAKVKAGLEPHPAIAAAIAAAPAST